MRWVTLHLEGLKSALYVYLQACLLFGGIRVQVPCHGVDQCFLTGGNFAPRGHWKWLETFLVVTFWGRKCYWHLVDGGLECCSTSCKVQEGS